MNRTGIPSNSLECVRPVAALACGGLAPLSYKLSTDADCDRSQGTKAPTGRRTPRSCRFTTVEDSLQRQRRWMAFLPGSRFRQPCKRLDRLESLSYPVATAPGSDIDYLKTRSKNAATAASTFTGLSLKGCQIVAGGRSAAKTTGRRRK